MTSSKYNDLNDVFDVESEIVSPSDMKREIAKLTSNKDDIKKDYDYTRGNLYSIIEKGQDAINSILELAQDIEMPRAYEVAGQLIKNVSDATDKLMDLQKKVKDLEKEEDVKGPTTVNNALFVGSTADLQKLIKQGFKQDDAK